MLFLEENLSSTRLLFAAGALIAGEGAGFALAVLGFSSVWVGIAGALVLVGLAAYGLGARHLLYPALAALGLVLALRTDARLCAILDDNAGFSGPRPALRIPVEGDVRTLPATRRRPRGTRVDFLSRVGPIPLKVIVTLPPGAERPRSGETWRVTGWISQKSDPSRRYTRRKLWVPAGHAARCPDIGHLDVARAWWSDLGADLARRAEIGLSWCPELAGLNRAILLGRRSDLPPERRQTFADAGTIHVFAISGLHVMVVATFLRTALLRLGVAAKPCGLVCLPLVWAYVVLTGARPSAIRAATMATLLLAAPMLNRRSNMLASWSITAFGVYALAPENLFDLGCALSFAVMFGIVFWCQWAPHFQPWFEEKSRMREFAATLGVSFAAWLAGVPLTAHAFGRITPGGLLANLVILVCAKWMVSLGAGGLAASFLCLPLAALLNIAAVLCTWVMTEVSEFVAALPFSTFVVAPWSGLACLLWYVGCFLAFDLAGRALPRRGLAPTRWWRAPRADLPPTPRSEADALALAQSHRPVQSGHGIMGGPG